MQIIVDPTNRPFHYTYPKRDPHHFDPAFEGTIRLGDKELRFQIGFRQRRTPGKERMMAYVFINRSPRAEFVAADDYASSGMMVCLVKTREGCQVRPNEPVPPEYANFRLEPYDSYVSMRPTRHGLAVICSKDDHETMAKVGLIRTQFKEERA
jgi:hypothetical protein